MELTAVIEALKKLKFPSTISVITDSKYVKDGITKWIYNWKEKNWKTANKKNVKNKDLWVELDVLVQKHIVKWEWIHGNEVIVLQK